METETLTLRQASMEDLPQVKNMYQEIALDMKCRGLEIWDDVYPCQFLQEDIAKHQLYILHTQQDIISAFVLCPSNSGEKSVTWLEPGASACYLDRFGVNVHYTRQGVGNLTLSKARELARDLHVDYMRLFVVAENVPAIRLYEKNSFLRADGSYDEVVDSDLTLHQYGYEIKTF